MNNNIKIVSEADERHLLSKVKNNKKYKVIVLLMLDAGLRISEVIDIQLSSFNFMSKEIRIKSLKKKSDKPVYRSIPISHRLFEALSEYLTKKNLKDDDYLFPSKQSKSGHIERIGVYKKLKRISNYAIHPHMLRHTFATKIIQDNSLLVTSHLLGHASTTTTEIYTHTSFNDRLTAINSIDKPSLFERAKRKFSKPKYIAIQTKKINNIKTVGRVKELATIHEAFDKKINTFLQGPMGVGKSHLLKQYQDEENVLWLDDFKMVKVTLGNLLKHLATVGKGEMIKLHSGKNLTDNFITKTSSNRIIEIILAVIDKKEFTLIIDDITHITKAGVQVLERLKNKFHMIVAGRRIKIDYSSFLSNFQKLDIHGFKRDDSTKLIYLLSQHLRDRIEDYEAFKNYVYDQSSGIPLYINELIDRLSKEQFITSKELGSISHIHSKQYIDFTLPIIICISSLMVLRYVGGEMGQDSGAFKLFGGVFLVFALFARSLFQVSRRKYV